ncbi:MAG: hypothetical protein RR277_06540 [Rikenellaceae bacterium]
MKKVMLIFAMIVAMSGFSSNLKAQDYRAGIGLSLGAPMGLDYKQFFSPRSAINATFGYTFQYNALTIGAVYQYHMPIVENLNAYVGAGVNFGAMYMGDEYFYRGSEFLFGLTPNVGVEYKFAGVPIVLGLDYRPSVNFSVKSQWNQAALKVRYTF